MLPATAVPAHSLNTLDRIAFYKSVREKRKQLQLNQQSNGKESRTSSTENTFLTQMLQSSSPSVASSSNSSSLSISSLLRKGDFSSSSSSSAHRTVTSTLTNILPALLNGTLPSPRASSPADSSSINILSLTSPNTINMTNTRIETKCSTSLPVSPASNIEKDHRASVPSSSSPPRCRSYPTADLSQRASPTKKSLAPSISTSTTHLLSNASSCPTLINSNPTNSSLSSTSPSPDETTPKIVRSASVKSCASDSGVSSSSPLSDNNIVHVFRSNHLETMSQSQTINGSRKRKSLAHFYEELNKDKKFSTEASVTSGFGMSTSSTTNTNIPYNQQEALAIGYAQYALMQTLTQQFRANYPAAFLHAAAAAGYLPLPSSMMAAVAAATSSSPGNTSKMMTGIKSMESEKFLRKPPAPESDDNNNHIRVPPISNQDQPYRRETYQTLLESSQILRQHKLPKPVPVDLRKQHGTNDPSLLPSTLPYSSSSSSASSTSSLGSPPCLSPPKSNHTEPANDYVCIPKKMMPVIGARINDWLERNLNFVFSLSVINETLCNDREKLLLLSHIWHRLLLLSMIENTLEIYVMKDLQVTNDCPSSSSSSATTTVNQTHPTENDVKQIESLISRGKTLNIDEIGFNLIREVIIYKEGKTLLEPCKADAFEKAECQAQARLTSWCSSRVKYSKIVFFLCNIYQVKQDVFERLFCSGSMHQNTPISTYLERYLISLSTAATSSTMTINEN